MQLYFEPVTGQNRSAVEMLRVAKGQEGYAESVRECLTEADGRRSWRQWLCAMESFRFTGEKDVHGEDVMVFCRNTAEGRRHGRRQKS